MFLLCAIYGLYKGYLCQLVNELVFGISRFDDALITNLFGKGMFCTCIWYHESCVIQFKHTCKICVSCNKYMAKLEAAMKLIVYSSKYNLTRVRENSENVG